jgi:hypothetical protein
LYYLQRGSAISSNFSLRNLDQLEGEIQRAQFVKKEYGDTFYLKAVDLLHQKVNAHSRLLRGLKAEEAEIYAQKLEAIREAFHFKETQNSPFVRCKEKIQKITKAVQRKLRKDTNWKKIVK